MSPSRWRQMYATSLHWSARGPSLVGGGRHPQIGGCEETERRASVPRVLAADDLAHAVPLQSLGASSAADDGVARATTEVETALTEAGAVSDIAVQVGTVIRAAVGIDTAVAVGIDIAVAVGTDIGVAVENGVNDATERKAGKTIEGRTTTIAQRKGG